MAEGYLVHVDLIIGNLVQTVKQFCKLIDVEVADYMSKTRS